MKKKTNQTIEPQRFRGNIHVDGMEAWEERNWIGKIIKINDISFKVEKNIPRCVAINLKPKSDDNSFDLDRKLIYNLCKDIIMPNEKFQEFLEEKNIFWMDDFPVVNTMILKFIKN